MYCLKNISFLGRKTKIIIQNENGPCPLIAISNVLLLRGQISFHDDESVVDLYTLLQIVTNKVIEMNTSRQESVLKLLDSVLSIIPKLQYGLDVNIFFDDASHFEFTEELVAFDALDISLFHGWIIDPQDKNASFLSAKSYNALLYQLVEYKGFFNAHSHPFSI